MKLRHEYLSGEVVNTCFGQVELDKQGFVVNRDALEASDEELLTLPGIIDNDEFPISDRWDAELPVEELPTGEEESPSSEEESPEEESPSSEEESPEE